MDDRTRIFISNLKHYINLSKKSQKEIAEAINVPESTFSTWMKGKATPRMGKLQLLADYFGCTITDLIDEHTSNDNVMNMVLAHDFLIDTASAYNSMSPEERHKFEQMCKVMFPDHF